MAKEQTENGENPRRAPTRETPPPAFAGYRGSDFICAHAADRSLLKEGFTFAGATVNDFTSWFGSLKVGESREIVAKGLYVQVSKRPCGVGESGQAFALEDVGIEFDADDSVSDWQCARKMSWLK